MQTLTTSPQLESHSYRRSHSTANSTKPPVILSSEPPDAIAKLIIDPTCRRQPKASTHVLQRRRTQTIINRPKPPLEIATSYFADFTGRRRLRLGLRRELVPTGSATVEDEPYAKEPNVSPDFVGRLRLHKEWWFGQSDRQVREVFIVGVSRTARRVVIKNWAQRDGSPQGSRVSIHGCEEGVVVVAWDTLRVNFEDPFLRPASGDTGDW
ncbi:polyamine oxidase [Aspergillus lentulus]|uniref:Polyamine oxidase n=1 Tax=Aspergillus lentulus TaxID=293939 RepID=A0ABQ1AYS1_ASPLE|nr:polyamine oxidase [Aspergillus lentulus]GFF51655.1 polyamine oxidase [Aspergillus lentulus]GFF75234.1 polyamine oxidase [Aspergillus lentulus]GFF90540.1 polyamine oxidase [Aspergillus lentulus]